MSDQKDQERALQALDVELKRLEHEYTLFFAGRLPRPPAETRTRVDGMFRRLDLAQFNTSGLRFRFQSLQARYASFVDLWDRNLRAKEEGRIAPLVRSRGPRVEPPEPASQPVARASRASAPTTVAFRDPSSEPEKLQALYEAVSEARRGAGEDAVSYQKFARLVADQVQRIQRSGISEVAFRVSVKDGKVNLTAKAKKDDA